MAKLLQFRNSDRESGACRSERRRSSGGLAPDVPIPASAMGIFRSVAKEDIRTMLLMFDVALMHGRLALPNVEDLEATQRLEAHLGAIEEMLDTIRAKAANL